MNGPQEAENPPSLSLETTVNSASVPCGVSLPKIISFEDLIVCGDEIWIQFKGQIYRLRRTKQDKLILTK